MRLRQQGRQVKRGTGCARKTEQEIICKQDLPNHIIKSCHWCFLSRPKILYIVHLCVQFCSIGPWFPKLNSSCSCALVCECYLGAAGTRMLPIPTPCKRHQGIRKTQLIELVFFSIACRKCFRYLIKEQMSLKGGTQSTRPHCCLLFHRHNLAFPSPNKVTSTKYSG